ncbi:transcriptional regulator, HxlR family [Dysgonomonas macrotermitis]|uniref:Transcriptional regulator, HxlR family n=2 Tax=Dysgonomonas macrotermitis TaxID=1346286 RepID=A0A1M5HAL4_9BACT|nr:transcriptional regulator, HxlR family [Dysgonomonas macrotermitis]
MIKMKEKIKTELCPIRDIICRLSDKWSMLVIVILNDGGTMRFNEIQKAMDDISQRMLTVTLRSLEADGLISRRIYPEVPPRVEYSLTPLGTSLLPALTMLVDWAKENTGAIQESRRSFESVNK